MTKITTIEAGGISFSHKYDLTVPAEINTRHCHDTYEILLLTEGEGRYIVEGCEYNISAGTVMFTRPFEYHCININPEIPYERSVVAFPKDAVPEEAMGLFCDTYNTDGGGCFYPPEAISPFVISLFERFELSVAMPEREREIYLKLLVGELVVLLSAAKAQKLSYDDEDIGTKVRRYINDHISKDISLDVLSKRFFVSKYYLCRAFKRRNGVSIHGYITHKRVMYAKQLIDGGESASGAAYKVGFCDYSAFYRAYVKIIGKSPSAEGAREKNEI